MRAGLVSRCTMLALAAGLVALGAATAATASTDTAAHPAQAAVDASPRVTSSVRATPTGRRVVLTISADIDGRSVLTISGRTARWHHLTQAAPGRHLGGATVTKIGSATWKPVWPAAGENRDCNCNSNIFRGVTPPLPATGAITFKAVSCREACSATTGGGKAVITVDDNATASSALYVVTLSFVIASRASESDHDLTDPKVAVPAAGALSLGDKGAAVETLQKAMAALGLFRGKVDGVFGKDLQAAVAAYQKSKGLTPDGIVGPKAASMINKSVAAPDKIVVPAGKTLSLNDSGSAVVELQKSLAALGLFKGKADGVFGKDLQAAVMKYQQSKGLPADGEVGPGTAAKIGAGVEAPEKVVVPAGKSLSLSDSGAAVEALQKSLAALGLFKGKVDGVFGKDLQSAVAAYQKSKGLTADGTLSAKAAALLNASVADPGKIVVPAGKSLALSDSGSAVEQLQKALASLGLFKGRVDGVFGRDLQAAVVAFATSKGLPADGVVGPSTAAAINAAVK